MLKKIISNSLFSNTLKLSTGSIIQYIIPIVATPILTRIYTPEDYGEWGVFSSYAIILTVITCGGYEYAIVRPKNLKNVINVFTLAVLVNLSFFTFLLSCIFLAHVFNWEFINSIAGVWLIPFFVTFSGFIAIFRNLYNRIGKYSTIAISSVIAGISQALFRILIGLSNLSYNGLIIGSNLAIATNFSFLISVSKFIRRNRKHISYKRIILLARDYKKFPIFDMPSKLLDFMSNSLPIIILAHFFSKQAVGSFTLIVQLLLLPMAFIGTAMGAVYYKQISLSKTKEDISKVSKSVFGLTFYLSLAPILFFILNGSYILNIVLGDNWEVASKYGLYLSLWAFTTIMFYPLLPIFRVLNKQDVLLKLNALMFLSRIGIIYFGSIYIASIEIIIITYSLLSAIIWCLEGLIILKLNRLKLRKGERIRYILISSIVTVGWIIAVLNNIAL